MDELMFLQYMRAWVINRRAEQLQNEAGVSTVEWVIIAAVVAGLAIAVGAVIVSKVQSKANRLNLG